MRAKSKVRDEAGGPSPDDRSKPGAVSTTTGAAESGPESACGIGPDTSLSAGASPLFACDQPVPTAITRKINVCRRFLWRDLIAHSLPHGNLYFRFPRHELLLIVAHGSPYGTSST
jgi:hypothetical protein